MHSPDRQGSPGQDLLRIARLSIEHGLDHREPLPVRYDELSAALTEPAATFTTLHLDNALRGCCGSLEAVYPLALAVGSEEDLLATLTPGTDGLVIVEGLRRATFLPTVWESLPDPRQFLARLKIKCGLPVDYWSERLEFLRYRTTSYAEPE